MLEDEERKRLQSEAEEAGLPYEMEKDQYDGAMEEGAEQNALLVCGERTAEDRSRIRSQVPEAKSGGFRHFSPKLRTLENQTQAVFVRSEERRPPTTRSRRLYVEYKCIMAVFTLSLWKAQVWAIYVNSIKGSCPKLVTI